MLSVEEAQARLLAAVQPLEIVEIPLLQAHGRRLARPLVAKLTQPPFDAAAMDGYAVADLPGPWTIVGEAAAGRRFPHPLESGQAVRILTGAPVPAGTNTLIIQEDIERVGDRLRLAAVAPAPRANIRPAGLDFRAGDPLGDAGDLLTPARIGLLAAAGHACAPVHRLPRVAILATGNELVAPGTIPGPDQIVSSNSSLLAALVGAHADVTDAGIAPDEPAALARSLLALRDHDLILTVGGASVGDHDLIQPVLRDLGAAIDFWKVAVRPGKPLLAGSYGGAQVIGLPGNPVSAFVCATIFVLPMLRRMTGYRHALPPLLRATLGTAMSANGARRDYARGTLSGGIAVPAPTQDSSMLGTLARSNVLIVRAPFAGPAAAGDPVDCIRIDNIGDVA